MLLQKTNQRKKKFQIKIVEFVTVVFGMLDFQNISGWYAARKLTVCSVSVCVTLCRAITGQVCCPIIHFLEH